MKNMKKIYIKSILSMILCSALALSFTLLGDGGFTSHADTLLEEDKAAADTQGAFAQFSEPAVTTPSAVKAAAEANLPGGQYVIRPLVSSTRTLTVKSASIKSGANIYLYSCDMASNQLFDVSYDSLGRALIKNVNSKKYMSVSSKKAKRGTNVVQRTKSSSKTQRWILEPAGTSNGQKVFRVRSALSGKYYLHLAAGKDRNAANIRIWTANKSNAEKFIFVNTKSYAAPAAAPAVKNGIYKISSALSSSLFLSLPNNSTKNGAVPALAKSSNSLSQLFMFTYKDGYYQIRSLVSAKSMTIKSGSVLAKASTIQYSDSDKLSQRFKLVKTSGGTYQMIAKTGGLALRVASGVAASGRTLETWYPSSANSQKFTLTPVENIKLASDVYTISPYAKDGVNLSIKGSSTASGAAAVPEIDSRSFFQKFQITRQSDGVYSIENQGSQLLLTASGDNVVQTKKPSGNPANSQLWSSDLTFGGMRFTNKATGKAIQLAGSAGNYSLQLVAPSDSTKQAFIPVKTVLIDTGQYRLENKSGSKALEISDASFFSLANIQAGKADGSGTQAWFIKTNADGSLTIKNQRSGKSVEAASAASGANVRQNKSTSKSAQKWIIEECGDGWFRLRSATSSGAYLDASAGANTAGKSDVRAMSGTAGNVIDAQKWRLVPVKVVNAGPVMPKAAADAMEKEARKHLGKRYVFGTAGPKTFDCSGYVYYVLNNSDVKEMSRVTAQDIYNSCVTIAAKDAKRGDIIFFKNTYKTDRTVTHLGFYLGDGKMIHAGSPVQISKINTTYYKAHFYAYGRIA